LITAGGSTSAAIAWVGRESGVDEDKASSRREKEGSPPGQIHVGFGNEGDEGVQRELVVGEWKP
jgi:hypothetical protein